MKPPIKQSCPATGHTHTHTSGQEAAYFLLVLDLGTRRGKCQSHNLAALHHTIPIQCMVRWAPELLELLITRCNNAA